MGLKVVVTGASTGIGRATALRFAKDGHEVFATARSDSKLSETVKLAPAGTVHKGIGDVGVEADVLRNYEEAKKALGEQIDIIVLNAGVSGRGALVQDDDSVAEFDAIFNTNVRGAFLWLKCILPLFKKQGFGQIVFMNSVSGLEVFFPEVTIYSASKYALTALADGVRLDVKGTGIKVATVFPGPVDTPIWDSVPGGRERFKSKIDLAMTSDDIAVAVANIAYQSPRSDIDRVRVWPNFGLKKAS